MDESASENMAFEKRYPGQRLYLYDRSQKSSGLNVVILFKLKAKKPQEFYLCLNILSA